ncbi:MFS transporter [Actinomadura sp. 3N508]|uniref:MFS transporter n=1 Tax=Actinomadura sp. 3N508 TaxID=3375153 RepID=UPI00379144DC
MLVDSTESSLVSALFPVIRHSLGLSLEALGVLIAASKLVGTVAGPFWVWVARRWSRKGVLVLATGLWGIWGVATGFAQNFTQLLILYTVLAAGYAAAYPLITEVIGDLFDASARGRAVGLVHGAIALAAASLAPVSGLLSKTDDGWRWGLWGIGAFNVLIGLALWAWFRDPGTGAAERQLADLDRTVRAKRSRVTWSQVRALFRIPTFLILLSSRILSGQLLISTFGVVFLTDVYGFSTATASIALMPLGIGYFVGNLLGGASADGAVRLSPRYGLVLVLQTAQVAFAVVAFFGTQFSHGHTIWVFGFFFGLMGVMVGVNPGVNRPMVMAVVPPELRGAAFAIYLSIFEAIAWAGYSFAAGWVGDVIGLKAVFFWVFVVLMLVNAAVLTPAYWTYRRDAERMQNELDTRRAAAIEPQSSFPA